MPHDIRLAGPWEFSEANSPDWQRCQLPWIAPESSETHTIRRKFHRPTGIDELSVLSLVIIAPAAIDCIVLNAASVLCTNASSAKTSNDSSDGLLFENEFVVTTQLKDFNTVEIAFGANLAAVEHVKLRITDG